MRAPVFVYYQLNNFYQNHRRWAVLPHWCSASHAGQYDVTRWTPNLRCPLLWEEARAPHHPGALLVCSAFCS